MRIVHILNESVETGNGIVNATVDLACMQARRGHNVHIVSCGGGYIDLLARHGVRHHCVSLRPRAILSMLRDLPRLRAILRHLQPDIVHAHMMTGAVLLWIGRSLAGFGAFGLVTTIHNEWRAASHLMRVGDRVVVLSRRGKLAAIARGMPRDNLCVVSHGIMDSPRLASFEPDNKPPEASNVSPVILTMAGLYRRKGIGDLMLAFAKIADEFPDAVLKIAGWGPASDLFETMRKDLVCADRIQFLGFVARTQSLLSRADIFVLASHTESFPLALAEARKAGCAVIGTMVGGVPELLEQGRSGLLVPPHDIDALAEAMRQLLAKPEALARWRRAAHFNLGWLSCARMEEETTNVYLSLLKERSRCAIGADRATSSARY